MRQPKQTRNIYLKLLLLLIFFYSSLHFWGLRKDLPYAPQNDEHIFVIQAVRMAASGDLNPRWFGNPGSTIMYPLAAIYHTWHALSYKGMFFRPDPNLQLRFDSSSSEFYLLGRLLSISYALMSIPLIYFVGRRAFGERVGLMGVTIFIFYSWPVFWAQHVRTDSSAVFFGMLSLWTSLKFHDRPTLLNQVIAGFVIGLSIASRYFMVALVPAFLSIAIFITLKQSRSQYKIHIFLSHTFWGMFAILIGFALSTPYFFIDTQTVFENMQHEARSTQLGFDGLSPLGNFLWYLSQAIPQNISWPQTVLVGIASVLVVWGGHPKQLALLVFIIVFLIGISMHYLHWQRWIIQILPILSILVAFSLNHTIRYLSNRIKLIKVGQKRACVILTLLISMIPAYQLGLFTMQLTNPSTRILAREWALKNIPLGSKVVLDKNAAPLAGTGIVVYEQSWRPPDRPLEDYIDEGYEYFFLNLRYYELYLNESQLFQDNIEFYQTLFNSCPLLYESRPSMTRSGPVIQIYKLPCN